jgi:hypothetical protein
MNLSKISEFWDSLGRPLQLIVVVAFTLTVSYSILFSMDSPMIRDLIHPRLNISGLQVDYKSAEKVLERKISSQDVSLLNYRVNKWKSLYQLTAIVLGTPIAFMVWYWRDRNVRDQIEIGRRDISLKEFQEVQIRAAGALDKTIDPQAREALQIASLHQMRVFLQKKDKYLRTPALELLLAGHVADMDRLGTRQLESRSIRGRGTTESGRVDADGFFAKLRDKRYRVTLERMGIIRDESGTLFTSKLDFEGRNFDLLTLEIPNNVRPLNFTGTSFFGTFLCGSDLTGHDLSLCRLQGSDLRGTNWAKAKSLTGAVRDKNTKLNSSVNIEWDDITLSEQDELRAKFDALTQITKRQSSGKTSLSAKGKAAAQNFSNDLNKGDRSTSQSLKADSKVAKIGRKIKVSNGLPAK